MRVTYSSTFREGTAEINQASQRLTEAQRQVSFRPPARPAERRSDGRRRRDHRPRVDRSIDTYTRTTDAATSRLDRGRFGHVRHRRQDFRRADDGRWARAARRRRRASAMRPRRTSRASATRCSPI